MPPWSWTACCPTKRQACPTVTFAADSARRRSVMLYTKAKPMTEAVTPSFGERDKWKGTRRYQ